MEYKEYNYQCPEFVYQLWKFPEILKLSMFTDVIMISFENNVYGNIVLHICVLGPFLGLVIMIVFILVTGTGNYD